MKKLLALCLLIPFLFCISCSGEPADNEPNLGSKGKLSGKTAAEYFEENKLYIGWNIGNTLDGPDETAWLPFQNFAYINQDLMNGIKAAGFNLVRIPITWNFDRANKFGRPIGPAPEYRLNEDRLERVAEVVDMAYNAGLAVIINLHHDGAPAHASDSMFWLNIGAAASNETQYTELTAKFTAVWKQIAERFRDYGDWLIFEGHNELQAGQGSQGAWGWNVPDNQLTVINNWNQVFTDTIREVGGNNTDRFLVIQPISARAHFAIADYVVPAEIQGNPQVSVAFTLPIDPTPNKQIVSMHWYYPESFCLYGTTYYNTVWGTELAHKDIIINGGTSNPPYGTEAPDTTSTGGVGFSHFKSRYKDNGIPVIIGECGVTFQGNRNETQTEIADTSRLAFLTYFCEQAKVHGLTPILWDNGSNLSGQNNENFGLFNRETGEPLGKREDELIKAMVNAVK